MILSYEYIRHMKRLYLYFRLKISLDSPEPRVHFALVCGAKSCPPIKTYSPEVCKNVAPSIRHVYVGCVVV
jgi:hypothetical protein